MKLRRLLASVLALLLVVSILPIGALADDTNTGVVDVNYGTLTNNGTEEGGRDSGTVEKNAGTITNNYGTVNNNTEFVLGSCDPTISNNYGLVKENNNLVENNKSKGEVTINNGTVGKEVDGAVVGGNDGTIGTNSGTVISNNEYGKVETNAEGGKIEINDGLVGITDDYGYLRFDEGTGNLGDIGINNGTVTINGKNATVGTNDGDIVENYGDVGTNDAWIYENYGDVGTNDYWIDENYGDVGTNDGMVCSNYGTVDTNTIGGKVYNETIQDQEGKDITGTVTNNYGTVYNRVPGNDGDYYYYQATYGVEVKNTDGGAGTKLIQAVEETIVKLAGLFKRDGYELVGYENITPKTERPDEEAYYSVESARNGDPSAQELSATEFQAKRPSILSLIWKAIVKPPVSSDEPETKTVQNNIPNSLSAGQVTVGAYVRRGNVLFRIIEVGDDYIRVATVGKLSEKSLSDMMGFLKQHLSAAQIAKLSGEPKLLEQELVTQFFGDTIDHISFYAAPDLFE